MLTLILSIAGCALLFFGIWGVTITMPTAMLAQNFPKDVQEALKPRLDRIDKQPMTPKRILGWVILILFLTGYIALFIIGGVDGMNHGFEFGQFFLRFFIIGGVGIYQLIGDIIKGFIDICFRTLCQNVIVALRCHVFPSAFSVKTSHL